MYASRSQFLCDLCSQHYAKDTSTTLMFPLAHLHICPACAHDHALRLTDDGDPTCAGVVITINDLWPRLHKKVQAAYVTTLRGMDDFMEGQSKNDGYALARWVAENTIYSLAFAVGWARVQVGAISYARTVPLTAIPWLYGGLELTTPPINALPLAGTRGRWLVIWRNDRSDICRFQIIDDLTEAEAHREARGQAGDDTVWRVTRLY